MTGGQRIKDMMSVLTPITSTSTSASAVTRRRLGLLIAVASLWCLIACAPALAAQQWRIDALVDSTARPAATVQYFAQMSNVGDAAMDGSNVDVTVTMPSGVSVQSAFVFDAFTFTVVPCADATDGTSTVVGAARIICHSSSPLPFGLSASAFQKLFLTASVDPGASGVQTARFRVSGGGAPAAGAAAPLEVTSAVPSFGVSAFDGNVAGDAAGTPFTQAGGNPFSASVSIDFNTTTKPDPIAGPIFPVEPTKDVLVDLPPGLVGSVTAANKCTLAQLANAESLLAKPLCPPTSQIGTTLIGQRGQLTSTLLLGPLPVFNMVAPPGVPARFGFNVLGTVITLDASLRSDGDYGLSVNAKNIPEGLAISRNSVTFWGVPASPAHDNERACAGGDYPAEGGPTCKSGAPLKAFLRNPTSCTPAGVGLPTTAHVDSWTNPGVFKQASWLSHLSPGYPELPADWGAQTGPTGCEKVPFKPSFTASPVPGRAGGPAGMSVDLSVPQTDEPGIVQSSDLRKAVVTLPAGVRVSPSSADGLGACSPADIKLHVDADPSCPNSAKIGTATITTPLLPDPLDGSIYLAKPHDNPFGSLLSLYLVAKGSGVVVKLPGRVSADPDTGQLTATFDDNPQLPFSNLHLEFKDGPRAPLVLPTACGTYSTHATLTGWSGKTVVIDAPFTVDENCQAPRFSPSLDAGAVNPTAGASSSFALRVQRSDADQEIQSITTKLPQGLLAHIGNVTQCADTAACTAASQIGRVTVGAGAGSNPFYITTGKVYLTGPYKGAPFGLLIRVPAVAGPFDLGNVDVRAALRVDPITAAATVIADPLPRYLQGIPVLARDIRVTIDRPGFMLNPTNCTPTTINAAVASFENTTANLSNRFQVGDCANLKLKPKLAIALTGKGQTTDGKHPGVDASLKQPTGGANLKKVVVTLPLSLALDPDNAQALCEFTDGSKVEPTCPKGSVVGTATARTPILNQPLTGPVYFVKNVRVDPKSGRQIRTLPKLVIPLSGENGLRLNLVGTSNVVGDRLVTTFDNIPDAPVSDFALNITGGSHGILVVSGTDICKATQVADQQVDGQNGKTADADIALQTPGCSLKILSKTVGKSSVAIKVGGLAAGKVTISGKGIKKTTKTITTVTVATITAKRTKGKPGKVTVSYDPTGPAKARKTTK